MGTLNYMSPEQVKGTSVDAASGHLLGRVRCCMSCSRINRHFQDRFPSEVLQRILNGVPNPITEYCPDIDPRLVELVDRALEKDPNRRFQSIASVQKELASIRLSPQPAVMTSTPTPTPTPARKTPSPAKRDLAALRAQHIDEHLVAAQRRIRFGRLRRRDRIVQRSADAQRLRRPRRSRSSIAFTRRSTNSKPPFARRSSGPGRNSRAAIRRRRCVQSSRSLALEPDNADAQALGAAAAAAIREIEEQARLHAAVDEARRRFADGEHQAALQSLEALATDIEHARDRYARRTASRPS